MARLFIISFILLFCEMMAIRWLGSELPIVHNHANLVLMVAFVGASVGLIKDRAIANWTLWLACLVLLSALLLAGNLGLDHLSINPHGMRSLINAGICAGVLGTIVVCLLAIFIKLGGALRTAFVQTDALRAYAVNLIGSAAGVISFAALSWLNQPPYVWLAVVAILVFLLTRNRTVLLAAPLVVAVSAFLLAGSFWSPYNKITIDSSDLAPAGLAGQFLRAIDTNNIYMENITPILTAEEERRFCAHAADPASMFVCYLQKWLDVPYLYAPHHDRVLILGSGAGDDVAYASKHYGSSIDAVEIDPLIASLGKTLHPEHPYLDKNVHLYVDDARSFIKHSRQKYDLIHYAYLDAGVRRGAISFVREDSFVYTVESFQEALGHLTGDGVLAVSYAAPASFSGSAMLYRTIQRAQDGKPPLALSGRDGVWFLCGPGLKHDGESLGPLKLPLWKPTEASATVATDDWPFLGADLRSWTFSIYIATLMLAVLVPAFVLSGVAPEELRKRDNLVCMLLGQGFMLVEVKAIAQLSLVFGVTWLVNTIVVTAILLLAWLANELARRLQPVRLSPWFAGLVASLLLSYFLPIDTIAPALAVAITCLPVFFSGVIFSTVLKASAKPEVALGANVLGVALGGLCENFCLLGGLRSLSLLAIAIYLLAFARLCFAPRRSPLASFAGD